MTRSRREVVALEVAQFVPVVAFAFRFLLAGEVDLAQAGPQFVLGAALALGVLGVVLARRAPVNPILLGADLWLAVGAVGFGAPIPAVAAAVGELAGSGLFAAILLAGIGATVVSPRGFVGAPVDRRWSWALVGLTAALVVYTWWMRHDVRLGGGLPFIVLNLVRRGLGLRLPRVEGV
ncbi:MAG: hypothetical protein ABMA64_37320 [Myxococcota bacterium]